MNETKSFGDHERQGAGGPPPDSGASKHLAERWLDDMLNRAPDLLARIEKLLAGKLGLPELGELLTWVIQLAELVLGGPGRGAEKKALVRSILDELNTRYQWRRALERAIRLPFPLEWLDDRILPVFEGVAIDLIVAALNTVGGWLEPRPEFAGPAGEPTP